MGDEFRRRRAFARMGVHRRTVGKVAFAVALTVVLLLTSRLLLPGETGRSPAEGAAGLIAGGVAGSSSVRPGPCDKVGIAEVRALEAAGAAAAEWEVHIGAMNKLVLGYITFEQAQVFWDETREEASRTLAKLDDAQQVLARRRAGCPEPFGLTSEGPRSCAAVIGARQRELDRAAVALDTWRTHLQGMEKLRRGETTPEEATRQWLESWAVRSRQMDAYRSAARATKRAVGRYRDRDQAGRVEEPCAARP